MKRHEHCCIRFFFLSLSLSLALSVSASPALAFSSLSLCLHLRFSGLRLPQSRAQGPGDRHDGRPESGKDPRKRPLRLHRGHRDGEGAAVRLHVTEVIRPVQRHEMVAMQHPLYVCVSVYVCVCVCERESELWGAKQHAMAHTCNEPDPKHTVVSSLPSLPSLPSLLRYRAAERLLGLDEDQVRARWRIMRSFPSR